MLMVTVLAFVDGEVGEAGEAGEADEPSSFIGVACVLLLLVEERGSEENSRFMSMPSVSPPVIIVSGYVNHQQRFLSIV